jgi:hypothetical protein
MLYSQCHTCPAVWRRHGTQQKYDLMLRHHPDQWGFWEWLGQTPCWCKSRSFHTTATITHPCSPCHSFGQCQQGSSERCALALIADNSDSIRRNSGQNEASISALHNVESAQDEHKSALKAHFRSVTSPSFPLFRWQCLPRKRSSPHGLRGRRAA